MKAWLKCVHRLVPISVVLFFGTYLFLVAISTGHVGIEAFWPIKGGHGSVPVFLLFFPSYFIFVVGIGFSAIRLWEIRCAKRKSKEEVSSTR